MSTDSLLNELKKRHDELQKQLNNMQKEHERLDALHTQQYLRSIEESMTSLFEVIVYVRKADKHLVEWHHRSDNLKVALRWIGVDRRTTAVVEKKTKKLKAKVSVVESKFDRADDTVATGLRATESLKSEFVHFSHHSVDQVSRETIKARDTLDMDQEVIEAQIRVQREHEIETTDRIRETATSLTTTINRRENAEGARGVFAAGSVVGFSLAAVSAVLFPPSSLVIGSALAAGAGAGALACAANEDVNRLESEQQLLTQSLSKHEESIKVLERELSGLGERRSECTNAISLVESLQAQTGKFRASVQAHVDYMRETKLCLEKMRLKLADIIRKLHECQYEETRRCIGARLREVLAIIQGAPKTITTAKPKEVRKAMKYLTDIDSKTGEVVRILTLSQISGGQLLCK